MTNDSFAKLGERVLKTSSREDAHTVGVLITQLAKERRKSQDAELALQLERESRVKDAEVATKLPPAMSTQQRGLLKRYLEIQRGTRQPTKPPEAKEEDGVVFESMEWSARLNPGLGSSSEMDTLLDLIRYQEER